VHDQISTRRLRVVKYRGSHHGPDEYPFLIDRNGFSVLPVASIGLDHDASDERVSTGVGELDRMLDGGVFQGSSVLISGTPGSGKTTLGARFLEAGCERGERGMLFAFEESRVQIARNMRSVGIDVQRWVDAGMLRIVSARPAAYGLETHLVRLYRAVEEFEPANVVIDPLSALNGEDFELMAMLSRLIDHFKSRQTTAVMTTLIRGEFDDRAGLGISSVIDTWVDVSNLEIHGERNRGINVLKSRGMAHSSQVREFQITSKGPYIRDVYAGERGVLMGSARRSQEARDRAQAISRGEELEAKRQQLKSRRSTLEAQIAALHDQLEAETQMLSSEIEAGERLERQLEQDRQAIISARSGITSPENGHEEMS
jgi:circadian clock protein KaiC